VTNAFNVVEGARARAPHSWRGVPPG